MGNQKCLGFFFLLCSENFEKAAYIEERQGVAFCFCFQMSMTHSVISQRPGLLNPNPAAGSMSFAQLSASSAARALCSAETSRSGCSTGWFNLQHLQPGVWEELPHSKIPQAL